MRTAASSTQESSPAASSSSSRSLAARLLLAAVLASVPAATAGTMLVNLGEPAEVICPVSAQTNASDGAVLWIHPSGAEISASHSKQGYQLNNGSVLTIQEVRPSDAGMFTCVTRTGETLTSRSVELVLQPSELPYWRQNTHNLTVAFVAALVFLVVSGAICLIHRFRYERRHKTGDFASGGLNNQAHSNPALDLEAETHL